MLDITLPKGTKGFWMPKVRNYNNEMEFLLPRDTKLLVKEVTKETVLINEVPTTVHRVIAEVVLS